jgi:hypothetical protein
VFRVFYYNLHKISKLYSHILLTIQILPVYFTMSKPGLHTRPINYGVELEFVFAFHEDELVLGSSDGRPNILKKDMKYHEREEYPRFTRISPYAMPDHAYNSWGVLEAGDPTKNHPVRITSVLCTILFATP